MNKEKLNEKENKITKAIADYLKSRLGMFGINDYEFKWDKINSGVPTIVGEQKIPKEHLGIFKHMIKFASLHIEISNKLDFARVRFMYNHTNGGSNGHELDFSLIINNKGEVFEK